MYSDTFGQFIFSFVSFGILKRPHLVNWVLSLSQKVNLFLPLILLLANFILVIGEEGEQPIWASSGSLYYYSLLLSAVLSIFRLFFSVDLRRTWMVSDWQLFIDRLSRLVSAYQNPWRTRTWNLNQNILLSTVRPKSTEKYLLLNLNWCPFPPTSGVAPKLIFPFLLSWN